MGKQQARMESAVVKLQRYILSYHLQPGYQNYSDTTFLNDMLYGIGIALDPEAHANALGFDTFKDVLRKHLAKDQPIPSQEAG